MRSFDDLAIAAYFCLIGSASLIFIGYKADKQNGKMYFYCRNLFDPHHG